MKSVGHAYITSWLWNNVLTRCLFYKTVYTSLLKLHGVFDPCSFRWSSLCGMYDHVQGVAGVAVNIWWRSWFIKLYWAIVHLWFFPVNFPAELSISSKCSTCVVSSHFTVLSTVVRCFAKLNFELEECILDRLVMKGQLECVMIAASNIVPSYNKVRASRVGLRQPRWICYLFDFCVESTITVLLLFLIFHFYIWCFSLRNQWWFFCFR